MSSIDLDEEEYRSQIMSDLSTSDLTSPMKLEKKKMFDITELLDSEEFENLEFSSTNVVDYLRIQNEQENYEESQWKSEENYLKYGKTDHQSF
jgi:aspartate carbamoyltransferase catalytic subunit